MKFSSAVVALSSAFLASSSNAQDAPTLTIAGVATSTGNHGTLVTLATQANLVDALSGDGPLTLFGPTDAAFTALGPVKYTESEWSEHLADILTYHVIADAKVMSTDLTAGQKVTMLNGGETEITSLTPPSINNATIDPADVEATNGVVHVIDQVLLPTSVTSDIVDVASGADAFSTLVELVAAADFVDTLKSDGPFTVFAPTNDAFAELDAATVEFLKSPEGKEDLTGILTYHVYSGVVYQSAVADGDIEMVSGDMATLAVGPPATIAGATIGDQILVSNGVIHVIDKVIMPPTTDETPEPDTSDATPAPAPVDEPEPDNSGAISVGSMFALASAAVVALLA